MPSRFWLLGSIIASAGAHVPSSNGSALYAAAAAYVGSTGKDEGGAGGAPYPLADEAPPPWRSDDGGPSLHPAREAPPPPLGKGKRPPPVHHFEFNAYFRWFWWLIVLYFFWAQAEVCDEYFVPTIEVICDIFGIPEDVAGATIMALGCNGPELFINTVAVFKESDLGVGAVVGGEVFNILVLCGAAVLVTPREYMPLRLSKFSFSRDVLFYALSVGLLYWAMADNWVGLPESAVLLASGGVYSAVVANSEALRRRFGRGAGAVQRAAASPAASPRRGQSPSSLTSVTSFGEGGQLPAGPEEGGVLRVRALYDNRLVDRSRHWDRRFFRLGREGLLVSTDVRPTGAGRTARGIVFEHGDSGQDGAWHHGGLVNAPAPRHGAPSPQWTASSFHGCGEAQGAERAADAPERAGPAAPDSPASGRPGVGRAASDPEVPLREKRWEVVPLQDVVACRAAVSPQSSGFELQVLQRGSDVLAKVVRLELEAPSPDARKAWVAAIAQGMQAARGQAAAASATGTFPAAASAQRRPSALREWMDWLRFPVQFLLRVTVPDVKRPAARRWFPLAFLMSMAWLAVFSFCVVEICDILHDEFGISVTILGFTLAAIGTSFPNVISCIAVSRQGRTSMAIANALGANIQNVFLALALPWTIQVLIKGGPFRVSKTDLNTSVAAMVVTLLLLVGVVLAARCRMPRWTGAVFLLIYAVYLVITIGQDLTCGRWPLPC